MKHKKLHPPRFWVAVGLAMFLILLAWITTFRFTQNGREESLFSIFRSAGERVRSLFQKTDTEQAEDKRIEELRQRVFPEFQ